MSVPVYAHNYVMYICAYTHVSIYALHSSQECFDVILYLPVERPTRPLISINIADLQPYPAASPNSPGSVAEPYDVKTPAMLRLVQREFSENPQGNRYG